MTHYFDDETSPSSELSGNSFYGGLAGTSFAMPRLSNSTARLVENCQRGADAALHRFGIGEKLVPPRIIDHMSKLDAVAHNPTFEHASQLNALMRNPAIEYARRLNALMRNPAIEHASRLNALMRNPVIEYANRHSLISECTSKLNTVLGRSLAEYIPQDDERNAPPPSIVTTQLDVLVVTDTLPATDQVVQNERLSELPTIVAAARGAVGAMTRRRVPQQLISLLIAFVPHAQKELSDEEIVQFRLPLLAESSYVERDGVTWRLTGRGLDILRRYAPQYIEHSAETILILDMNIQIPGDVFARMLIYCDEHGTNMQQLIGDLLASFTGSDPQSPQPPRGRHLQLVP